MNPKILAGSEALDSIENPDIHQTSKHDYACNPCSRPMSTMDDALRGTFDWIFARSIFATSRAKPRRDFPAWLEESGSSFFRISDERGSDVFTTTRYIATKEVYDQVLLEGDADDFIVKASFFAYHWAYGNSNSLRDLLCLLLLQIIEQQPRLIQSMSRHLLKNSRPSSDKSLGSSNLRCGLKSFQQLRDVWEAVHSQSPCSVKFVLFIDGLDDFLNQNTDELLRFISFSPSFESVRVCVLSRPVPWIAHHLRHGPNSAMQNFTPMDIATFVDSRPECVKHWQCSSSKAKRSSTTVQYLREELALRADGEFPSMSLAIRFFRT